MFFLFGKIISFLNIFFFNIKYCRDKNIFHVKKFVHNFRHYLYKGMFTITNIRYNHKTKKKTQLANHYFYYMNENTSSTKERNGWGKG